MRIIYFTRDYTPHDHRFLSGLAETKHEVFYLRLEKRGHVLEDRPLPSRITQIQWMGGQRPVRLRDGFKLLRGLNRVIRELNPDLIHAGPIQTVSFLSALSNCKQLVSMSWGYDLLQDANRGIGWQWVTRFTLRRSSVLVADCQVVSNQAQRFGMKPDRIVVFPWGVDLTHFKPGSKDYKLDNPLDSFTIVSTRSWEPIYGVDILAEAFTIAAKEHPGLRLMMAGNGSLAGQLRKTFQQGGVLDRVSFLGHVAQKDIPRLFHSSDLYISTSHIDGSSVSLMEALACGLPVLVSDIPANLEWVTPGVQGWFFSDGNPQALASMISHAAKNRGQLRSMGIAARSLAEARADWLVNFAKLEKAYQMAVSK